MPSPLIGPASQHLPYLPPPERLLLIKDQSPSNVPLTRRHSEINQSDSANGLTYAITPASEEYLLFLMHKISAIAPLERVWMPRIIYSKEPEELLDVFNLLRYSAPRLLTLRLQSDKPKRVEEFSRYADAFLFQISYNLDTALVPQRYLDELIRFSRISRGRRASVSELEAPRRSYLPDLVYHYQMGVATDSPPLEYLSYYHVAEHFFDSVFYDNLIEQVQHTITQPDFSYRRPKDVRKLIDYVTKQVKIRNEDVTFSELEALRLTLEKYVDIDLLNKKIADYDNTLFDYFKSTKVDFSDGDPVNLQDNNKAQVTRDVARRIYKTRNAIVHSKDGDKGRYIPFRHDRVLVKEVPLLRFTAELIIIATSSLLR